MGVADQCDYSGNHVCTAASGVGSSWSTQVSLNVMTESYS